MLIIRPRYFDEKSVSANQPFVPQIDNYLLACGMNSSGIVSSGGVGRSIAEWITEGKTSLDLSDFDVRRFGKIHMNPDFLANRASEILRRCDSFS